MSKRKMTATEVLKQAVSESGLAFIELERRTGVKRQCVMRFMRGETSLRLDIADRLMAALGVRVQLGPIPPVEKARKPRARAAKIPSCKK